MVHPQPPDLLFDVLGIAAGRGEILKQLVETGWERYGGTPYTERRDQPERIDVHR